MDNLLNALLLLMMVLIPFLMCAGTILQMMPEHCTIDNYETCTGGES